MAKKTSDNSAADDLIKSLLEEVNDGDDGSDENQESDSHQEEDNPFLGQSSVFQSERNFPLGLEPADGIKELSNEDPTELPDVVPVVENAKREQPAIAVVTPLPQAPQRSSVKPPSVPPSQGSSKNTPSGQPKAQRNFATTVLPTPKENDQANDHANNQTDGATRLASNKGVLEKVVVSPSRPGVDTTLTQAENLRLAQHRILQLEQEVDRLRQDNEEVSSAADIIRNRNEEMLVKIQDLERDRDEKNESAQSEILILKGQLQYKESELAKAIQKVEDLEIRLKNDFRKVRVRERELENRLELLKVEKAALIRSKDDNILELKRKVDQLEHEIENYRDKCLELNKTLDSHKEQFKRTVRALKLALTNLEVKDEEVVPLKKAD